VDWQGVVKHVYRYRKLREPTPTPTTPVNETHIFNFVLVKKEQESSLDSIEVLCYGAWAHALQSLRCDVSCGVVVPMAMERTVDLCVDGLARRCLTCVPYPLCG